MPDQSIKITKTNHLREIKDLLKQSDESLLVDFNLAIATAEKAKNLSLQHFYTQELADSLKQLSHCYAYISDYGNVMRAALDAMDLYKTCKNLRGPHFSVNK